MKPENPNAFPLEEKDTAGHHYKTHLGMTLRDYFAIEVLSGILMSQEWGGLEIKMTSGKSIKENMAIYSYEMADIMLKVRNE